MEHIPPEDDPLATRTLFTGNLELNITDEEIKRIFGRYGNLLDIDIKRPPPGKVENILKCKLESIPLPSVKIQIMGGKVCLRCKGKTLLGNVNKLFVFKSLLTALNNVLPLSKLSRP